MENYIWSNIKAALHNLVKADGGFSTAKHGLVTLPDSSKVFVKIGVDDNTRKWTKKEIAVYRFLERQNYPYVPRLLAVSPDETSFALEALDAANGWDWSESWATERLGITLEAMDALAAINPTGPDRVFFSHSAIDQSDNGWRPLVDSEEKQQMLLAKLRDAGYGVVAGSLDFTVMAERSERYVFRDDQLVHNDVRADNAAWNKNTHEVRLVDWNWMQLGDRRIDLAMTLTHVQKSGFGVLLDYASRLDADALHWLAGFWLHSASKPIWPGGPEHLRNHQLKAGVIALELSWQVGGVMWSSETGMWFIQPI
jgi:Ser/Thr protein kinase RdoA (MazF antagonist)